MVIGVLRLNNNLKILYDAYFKYIFNKSFGIMYMSRIISTLFDLDYDDLVNNIQLLALKMLEVNLLNLVLVMLFICIERKVLLLK